MSPGANLDRSKVGVETDLPYRIIQITDSHLGASRDQALLGINSYQSLELVVQLVEQERGQNFDRILGSGDISFDGSEQSYRNYLGLMERFERPISWIPGNHDCPEMMDSIIDAPLLQQSKLVKLPNWQLILLNSKISGATGGLLQEHELQLLENALQQANGKHSLVCLHHQPVPVGSQWLDPQQLSNAAHFFEIIDRYPGTRLVLWGHIHQLFDATREHIRLLSTPSTCHQFEPQQRKFKIGQQLPGYRWIDLYPNGTVDTGVSRIKSSPFEIDYQSNGY
ncbi:MAG: 3',5'-cyclic-AMP phosphodiesterase [Pseudomonadales bacterium]|nr:3',5'-cyclic-AMP phosphodiesterase [Pseudomonadales bacterium]